MSRAAKIFLTCSIVATGSVVYGVHWIQKKESDVMYQGVLKDDARLKLRAETLAKLSTPGAEILSPDDPATAPLHSLSTTIQPSSSLPPIAYESSSSSSSLPPIAYQSSAPSSSSPPLNTPSSPVQQPASVIDEDCETCKISPPPELVEKQSADERKKERRERWEEYERQKNLGQRLEAEQPVSRLV
ncbi:hypothetical protein BCR39DRAFT_591537 [Naematelia encephala]|uniref:Uncharacterized protein n=1 Tax=Naematelia encephala TaxID=71784 RepID=A0A1Y2AG72_9TREE|nr:hypothetical protein BCR39DRAFT_591537 [Naematelia encephala]